MNGRMFARIVMIVLFVALLIGVGVTTYQAGVAQGLVDSGRLVLPAPGAAPPLIGAVPYMPYYGWGWHRPFGFGFGCFGLLFPLLFIFLIFGLMRRAFWGGGWHHGKWEQRRQEMFDEWHRRAHGEAPSNPATAEKG